MVAVIQFISFFNDGNSTEETAYIGVAALIIAAILAALTQKREPAAVIEKLKLLKQIPALEQSLQQQIQMQNSSAKRFTEMEQQFGTGLPLTEYQKIRAEREAFIKSIQRVDDTGSVQGSPANQNEPPCVKQHGTTLLNPDDLDRELKKIAAHVTHPAAQAWIITVAKEHILNLDGADRDENFVRYDPDTWFFGRRYAGSLHRQHRHKQLYPLSKVAKNWQR